MTRIADGTRAVSWTESRTIAIGHHSCSWCGAETPTPTDADIVDFMRSVDGRPSTIWPGDDWKPAGWLYIDGEWFCPACAKARARALERARQACRPGEAPR